MVAKLGASTTLHEGEVEATNWMGALRATLETMSERPAVPPGASCSVDGQGVATVLDPGSRRKFVLTPMAAGSSAKSQAASPTAQPEPKPAPAAAAPVQPAAPAPAAAKPTTAARPQPAAPAADAGKRKR